MSNLRCKKVSRWKASVRSASVLSSLQRVQCSLATDGSNWIETPKVCITLIHGRGCMVRGWSSRCTGAPAPGPGTIHRSCTSLSMEPERYQGHAAKGHLTAISCPSFCRIPGNHSHYTVLVCFIPAQMQITCRRVSLELNPSFLGAFVQHTAWCPQSTSHRHHSTVCRPKSTPQSAWPSVTRFEMTCGERACAARRLSYPHLLASHLTP